MARWLARIWLPDFTSSLPSFRRLRFFPSPRIKLQFQPQASIRSNIAHNASSRLCFSDRCSLLEDKSVHFSPPPILLPSSLPKLTSTYQSYDAFIAEAGLPQDAGTTGKGDLTLEALLEEKKTFDVALRFEKLGLGGEGDESWSGLGAYCR